MSNRTPMRAMLRTLAIVLAVLAAPSLAYAQSDNAARARAGLDATAAARFDAALERARAQGLPTESIINKALEGIAKQVPAARIATAVEQRLAMLARARAALGPASQPAPEISSVADAMQRGVDAGAVRALRDQAPPEERIAVAVHVLADLADRGVPTDVALEVLGAWRQRGADPGELPDIPAGVDRLVKQGMPPAQAGSALAASIRAGLGAAGAPGRPAHPGARGRPDRLPVQPPVDPGTRPGRGRGRGQGGPPPGA